MQVFDTWPANKKRVEVALKMNVECWRRLNQILACGRPRRGWQCKPESNQVLSVRRWMNFMEICKRVKLDSRAVVVKRKGRKQDAVNRSETALVAVAQPTQTQMAQLNTQALAQGARPRNTRPFPRSHILLSPLSHRDGDLSLTGTGRLTRIGMWVNTTTPSSRLVITIPPYQSLTKMSIHPASFCLGPPS